MNLRKLFASFLLAVSSPAFADFEMELGGGQSTKLIEGLAGQSDVTAVSPDLTLYFGYRLMTFPLSFGLLASQKSYDISKLSSQYSLNASDFYEDSTLFPSAADITTAESSGSRSGLVLGPQVSLSLGFSQLDPYFRISYQMGTLKSLIDYQSTGEYLGNPIAYDFQIESDLKSSLLQYGLGVRLALGFTYIFADYCLEKLIATSDSETLTVRSLQAGIDSTNAQKTADSTKDDFDGQAFKIGFGLKL